MTNQASEFDARAAHDIMTQQDQLARQSLAFPEYLAFLPWAIAWPVAYTALYSSIRTQDPYEGAAGWAIGVLVAAFVIAAVAYAIVVARATRGLGSPVRVTGPWYGSAWVGAFMAMNILGGALADAGADTQVLGRFYTVMPVLLVGIISVLGGALFGSRALSITGVALMLTSMAVAPLDPVRGTLVAAVAGTVLYWAATVAAYLKSQRGMGGAP